jgi:hypothetical protein
VRIEGGGDPRETVIVNDSLGFATLVVADAVVAFDPRTMTTGARIPVGPAPEGVATDGTSLFVANSGYAMLRQSEPKAGTISVIDIARRVELRTIAAGVNVIDLYVMRGTGRLYALWGMPYPDSAGGVIEYDLATLKEVRRWGVTGAGVAGEMAFDEERGAMFVIGGAGLMLIDLSEAVSSPSLLVAGAAWSPLGFYGLGVEPVSGDLYIGYTTGFSVPGKTLMYDRGGAFKGSFPCGLNPGAFGFY